MPGMGSPVRFHWMMRMEKLCFFLSCMSFIMKIPAASPLSEALQRYVRLSMMMTLELVTIGGVLSCCCFEDFVHQEFEVAYGHCADRHCVVESDHGFVVFEDCDQLEWW